MLNPAGVLYHINIIHVTNSQPLRGWAEPQRGLIFVNTNMKSEIKNPSGVQPNKQIPIICTIPIANVEPRWGSENSTSQSVFTNSQPRWGWAKPHRRLILVTEKPA